MLLEVMEICNTPVEEHLLHGTRPRPF